MWKPALDFSFYEVSDLGRVRSVDRYVPHSRARSGTAYRRGKMYQQDVPEPGSLGELMADWAAMEDE